MSKAFILIHKCIWFVRILIRDFSSNSSSVAVTGNLPTSPGISPNLIRSSGPTFSKASAYVLSVFISFTLAENPIPEFVSD